MICDKIIFNNETIITVYHKGFPDEKLTKDRNITENIGENTITFTEQIELNEDMFSDTICVTEGFLDTTSKFNPYKGHSTCAMFKRYNGSKPNSIIKIDDKAFLNISLEKLDCILDFIKKYTGLDVSLDISLLGDILVFEPRYNSTEFSSTESSIVFKNLDSNSVISVNFIFNEVSVFSCLKTLESNSDLVKIKEPEKWDYAEIIIYKDGKIYYKNPYYKLFRDFTLNFDWGNKMVVSLQQFNTDVEITKHSYETQTVYCKDVVDMSQTVDLHSVQNQINLYKQNKRITFYKPGEEKKILSELASIFSNANDELWLIDPYFSDQKRIGYQRDILNIMYECISKSKNIVFYSDNKESDISNLENGLFKDERIERIFKYSKLNILFKQTKTPIHDRFIITKNNGIVTVYIIGTSFNSLNKNYFCIIKLDSSDSQMIYQEIMELLSNEDFCTSREY